MKVRFSALSILCVGAAAAIALPSRSAAIALFLPAIALFVGPRLTLTRVGETSLLLVAAALGLLLPTLASEAPRMGSALLLSERRTLFFFVALALASARCLLVEPRFGTPATMGVALVALAAAGGALSGTGYPLLVFGFGTFSLLALASEDHHQLFALRSRAKEATLALLILAGPTGLMLQAQLHIPELQEAAMERYRAELRKSQVSFTNRLALGDLYEALQSDIVVLRLRGKRQPELLRGAVLTQYLGGRWMPSRDPPVPTVSESEGAPPSGDEWLEIEHARPPERYFLPLDAVSVRTSNGYLSRDTLGITYPPSDDYAKRLWFRRGPLSGAAPPQGGEKGITPRLQRTLQALARAWIPEGASASRAMSEIERKLMASYRYELVASRPVGVEPVEEFLFQSKKGHCEYFASAAALLGRAAGIPTRIVTGYRVSEQSRFGYSIVRERNAHAWVEAWTGERWQTFDPTPADPNATESSEQTPLLAALSDRAATAWEALDDRLEKVTPLQFGFTLVLLLGFWMLLRAFRTKEERKLIELREAPLSEFIRVLERLERHGLTRGPSETLLVFRERVRSAEPLSSMQRERICQLLDDYGEHRYGRKQEEPKLKAALVQLAQSL
jgi:transglutaminase-like putative cysteine protease